MQESCKTKAEGLGRAQSKIYPVSVRHATYARRFQSSWKPHRSLERHLMAPRHESTTTTGTPTKCISRNCSVHVHYVWKSLKMSHFLKHCERSELHSFFGILEFCDFSCIDLIIKDDDGWTILWKSLKKSHFTTLRAKRSTFIFEFCDFSSIYLIIKDDDGWTAFMFACRYGRLDVVKFKLVK